MNRIDLQRLSRLRQREARVLLDAGLAPGAYYLAGYAVECALKACIAKQTRRHDFPDKTLATQAHVHDLDKLVRLAGMDPEFTAARVASPALELNWAVAKDWNERSRYDGTIDVTAASDLLSACTTRRNGVLAWIRARW